MATTGYGCKLGYPFDFKYTPFLSDAFFKAAKAATTPPNHVGKLIFVERAYKDRSGVEHGEYICTRQTANVVYGVSTKGGFDSAYEEKACEVVGSHPWNVVTSTAPPAGFVEKLANDLDDFVKTRKGNWSDHIYNGAANNARKLRELLPKPEMAAPAPAKRRFVKESVYRLLRPGEINVAIRQDGDDCEILLNGVEVGYFAADSGKLITYWCDVDDCRKLKAAGVSVGNDDGGSIDVD